MSVRFIRRGVFAASMLALLLPGAAVADTATATVPDAPAVYAQNGCDDVVLDGVVWCSVEVSWSAGTDDGGSPITSLTVTGNVSNKPTTVRVLGAKPEGYTVSWRWNRATNTDRAADTSYTVTATNAVGTSAPATVAVVVDDVQPRYGFVFRADDNGRKDDVLGFVFPRGSEARVVVRVNGRKHVLTPTYGVAELTVKDRNGRRPTLYTVRYAGSRRRLIAA